MDKVWYASYGSNMCYERFMCYIQGGLFHLNTIKTPQSGCTNKAPPIDNKPIVIPYRRYFGGNSKSWENKGTAFLDISEKSDKYNTIGRAYLITREQFDEVKAHEGPSYTEPVDLGNYGDYPVISFTSPTLRPENPPSANYVEVMEAGIRQMFSDIIIVPPANIIGT